MRCVFLFFDSFGISDMVEKKTALVLDFPPAYWIALNTTTQIYYILE